jgi:3D (Asp-Asp-Asp) domain-containing protein
MDAPTTRRTALLGLGTLLLGAGGCSSFSNASPPNADPRSVSPATGRILLVRTTAYHHSEPGGAVNAVGGRLKGRHSAAADWSWLPLGTMFRIRETGEDYVIEDYGSALVGKRTVDLYKTTRAAMRNWGVRHVHIEIEKMGSYRVSYNILKTRVHNRHCARMVAALKPLIAKGYQ